ncbi:hypothetical protein CXG81DRAFT_8068, partial [Caulochytrium protostelioides]
RKLYSSVLFPALSKEIQAHPETAAGLRALFVVSVLHKGVEKGDWYLHFPGSANRSPTISQNRPTIATREQANVPLIWIQLEDADILAFISGGLPPVKAITTKRVRVVGDLSLAQELGEILNKAGGLEKGIAALRKEGLLRDASARA